MIINNRYELIQKEYIKNKKSRKEVAAMLNISEFGLATYLHRHKIKRPLIKITRQFLIEEYINNKRSAYQIAKDFGYSSSVIYTFLKKHKIKRRTASEGNHLVRKHECNFSSYIEQFIVGELLGDGFVGGNGNYTAVYRHGTKHKTYLEWLSKEFSKCGIEQAGKILEYDRQFNSNVGKTTKMYHYVSKTYVELKALRKRFYPQEKKIIPKDLILTPIIVRQWYIGDGSLSKNNNSTNYRVRLSTNGFLEKDVDFLIEKLSEINIFCTKIREKTGFRIYVHTESTNTFLKYIGKCPDEIKSIYGYKWANT